MWGSLLDLLYPRTCHGCGVAGPSASAHLCWDCLSSVVLVQDPLCTICGNPVSGHIDHDYVCSLCTAARPHYDRARACARHDGLVREILMAFKYHKALWYARDLTELMLTGLNAHYAGEEIDAVAFVPLYPARKRERGFNQAEVLARGLGWRLRKPLLSRCLVRRRPTRSQTNLTAAERLTNVRGAFAAKWLRWVDGKRILLVDDVMTTGATVNECARALKKGGAARVNVLTAARRW